MSASEKGGQHGFQIPSALCVSLAATSCSSNCRRCRNRGIHFGRMRWAEQSAHFIIHKDERQSLHMRNLRWGHTRLEPFYGEIFLKIFEALRPTLARQPPCRIINQNVDPRLAGESTFFASSRLRNHGYS